MYSHECYATVRVTELQKRAVDHLLAQEDSDITAELRELKESRSDEVSFELVKKIHSKLKHTPLDSGQVWLHELVDGSELVLPTILPPKKKSPELEARLAKLRARSEQKEYNRMVQNVDPMRSNSDMQQLRLDVKSVNRQIWMFINYLLTVVGSFVFGFFLGYFADFQTTTSVLLGLIFGTAVFFADLYFIVRTDANIEKKTK